MIEIRFGGRISGARDASWIRKVVAQTLRTKKSKFKSVGVLITNNREIRRLNKRFLNHDAATDVIAFDLGSTADIVVSAQMAQSVSRELKISFHEELARYLVHGTLHLLGYRDKSPEDKRRMHKRQEALLREEKITCSKPE